VLENSGTGVSPVHSLTDATQTGETPVPLGCIYRDDAHGILPRIRFGAGCIRETPNAFGAGCLAILDAIYAKHGDAGCFDMALPLDKKRRLVWLGLPTRHIAAHHPSASPSSSSCRMAALTPEVASTIVGCRSTTERRT